MRKEQPTKRRKPSSLIHQLWKETTSLEKNRLQNKMRLAARLQDIIEAKSWNQREFAGKMQKQPSEITKWLSGTHNFTVDTLSDIATVLAIPLTDLLFPAAPIVQQYWAVVKSHSPLCPSIGYITPSEDILQSTRSDGWHSKHLMRHVQRDIGCVWTTQQQTELIRPAYYSSKESRKEKYA